jgi:hypothetical protein
VREVRVVLGKAARKPKLVARRIEHGNGSGSFQIWIIHRVIDDEMITERNKEMTDWRNKPMIQ